MSVKPGTQWSSGLWRAVCRAARALGHLHSEHVYAWEAGWQANRAAVPEDGPLRWVLTLDGHRLAGVHMPASSSDTKGGRTP
jgi:hypothetical protein